MEWVTTIKTFENFSLSKTDKKRLISSIKQVNEGNNLDQALDVNEIFKYFVVHNYVDNFDSYTGSLMHNYYLYEKDGKLSMIAWDYNLSFGGFGGMGMGAIGVTNSENITKETNADKMVDATSKTDDTSKKDNVTTYVNYPIDTPVSGTTMEDRPLINSLFSDEIYLTQYHDYFSQFISEYFESGYCDELIV